MIHYLLVLSAVAASALGSPHENVKRQVTQLRDSYDFIIAGGGTAGLTVADRLTEAFPNRTFWILLCSFARLIHLSPSGTVLVVEYGDIEEGPPNFEPPGTPMASRWSFDSLPMPALNNRTAFLMLGQAVGGSSLINGQFFDRGSKHDYNEWRTLGSPDFNAAEHKWDWNGFAPFFKKVRLLDIAIYPCLFQ
jgi:choline dehydrogenase